MTSPAQDRDARTAHSGSPSTDPAVAPAVTAENAAHLDRAVLTLRRCLTIFTVVLVAAQVLWALVGSVTAPVASVLVAAVASSVLLASIWYVLGRALKSTTPVGWVALGYLGRLAALGVVVLGGRALGVDTHLVGVSLIIAIFTGMLMETQALAQTRVITVTPSQRSGSESEG